jgi:hypothetical protein
LIVKPWLIVASPFILGAAIIAALNACEWLDKHRARRMGIGS